MIYYLYGENNYLIRKKTNEIIQGYGRVNKSGFNSRLFDLGEHSLNEVDDFFKTQAMFPEKKLAVIGGYSARDAICQDLLEIIKKNRLLEDKDIILVMLGGAKESGDLAKYLKQHAQTQEFKALENFKTQKWIIGEFRDQGVDVLPSVAGKILIMCGSDMWRLESEIKKLSAFKADSKSVSETDLEILVSAEIENDIFKTVDALANRNRKSALGLLAKHLKKGDDNLYLMSMFLYQFRNILKTKDLADRGDSLAAIVKKTKMHPYVAKKSLEQSKRFSLDDLKKIHRYFLDLDVKIKTGQIDSGEALNKLVFSLTY